jgi:SnoaL-like protein
MTPLVAPRGALPVDATSIAQAALASLSTALHAGDLDALLELFSSHPATTYAGSELGEIATGRQQLIDLFAGLLARPRRYRFEFDDVRAHPLGSTVWLLADGHGYESDRSCQQASPLGGEERFPYRLSGLLAIESGRWRWILLSGGEPTAPS